MLRTLWWFLRSPTLWGELVREVRYVLHGRGDYKRAEAVRRCAARAISPDELILRWGFDLNSRFSVVNRELIEEGINRAESRGFSISGGANLDVLYAAAVRCEARFVVETGVAAGWSTLAILAWLRSKSEGKLISIDRPYPGSESTEYVACVLPRDFIEDRRWNLVMRPDRSGIPRAIQTLGAIDLIHYDSDKTPQGRRFAYPVLYAALRPGGIFISDDVGDNMAFLEFVEMNGLSVEIVDAGDKYLGVIEKPR